jgi:hypothetical protein
MIDYDKPDDDPIVAEVRRAREEILAECNYDLKALCEAMQRREAMSRAHYATPRSRETPLPTSDPAKKVG